MFQRRTQVCLSIFLILAASTAQANQGGPAKEQLTFNLTTIANHTKDLEVTISNINVFTVVTNETKAPPFGVVATPLPGLTGTVGFEGADVAQGVVVPVTITTTSTRNELALDHAEWSFATGDNVPIPQFPATKFTVTPINDPMSDFTLTNNSDGFLTFTGLEFLNNVDDLGPDAPIGSVPGFTPFVATVTLAPHTASTDFIFPSLDAGKFLYIQGNEYASDANGNALDSSIPFRFGHQSEVPEPSAYLSMAVGILGVSCLRRRRKSRLPGENTSEPTADSCERTTLP